MSLSTAPGKTPNLLDLPVEIRHSIYSYLFLHRNPVAIGTRYITLEFDGAYNPVFYTALFSVSRKAHRDSIRYAYGKNQIILKDTFAAFTFLSLTAHAAIEHLTVVHSTWTAEHGSGDEVWACITANCSSLRYLELELHSDLLLQMVQYLTQFFESILPGQQRPSLILDLYVWARHFDFDGGTREYSRSLQMLRGGHRKTPSTPNFTDPKTRVLRLPTKAKAIVLSADTNAATVQAIDAFLADYDHVPLVKTSESIPKYGKRAIGRTHRYCYTWTEALP